MGFLCFVRKKGRLKACMWSKGLIKAFIRLFTSVVGISEESLSSLSCPCRNRPPNAAKPLDRDRFNSAKLETKLHASETDLLPKRISTRFGTWWLAPWPGHVWRTSCAVGHGLSWPGCWGSGVDFEESLDAKIDIHLDR